MYYRWSVVDLIKRCFKQHKCDWCGERIEQASSYYRWRCYSDDGASTCKMHPECFDALHESQVEEYSFGDNPRGCWCDFEADCERCKQIKGKYNEGL